MKSSPDPVNKADSAQLPVWKCELLPFTPPKEFPGITVGDKLSMTCSGDSVSWRENSIDFKPEQEKIRYKILKIDSLAPTGGRFQITTYKADQEAPKVMILTDGQTEVSVVPPLAIDVVSVVEKTEDGKPPQPFGPVGPSDLSWPVWLWPTVVLFLGGFILFLIVRLRKYHQKKKIKLDLQKHRTALSPADQLSKDLRNLHKQISFKPLDSSSLSQTQLSMSAPLQSHISQGSQEQSRQILRELDQAFRLFLVRQFAVPAQTWGVPALQKEIRKQLILKETATPQMARALRELRRGIEIATHIEPKDLEQFFEIVRNTATLLESQVRRARK